MISKAREDLNSGKSNKEKIMSVMEKIRESALIRLAIIGGLTLALLIPVSMAESLIQERIQYRNQAVREVSGLWGGKQQLIGPILVVPYRKHLKDEKGRPYVELHQASFLPEILNMQGRMGVEMRKRGIYEIPLYSLKWNLQGEFLRPEPGLLNIPARDFLWHEAILSLTIPDTRGIHEGDLKLIWNGRPLPFEPGTGIAETPASGVHVRIGDPRLLKSHHFQTTINLQGSEELQLAPLGKNTITEITSDWPDPSFNGAFLPVERRVDSHGFHARWQVSHLGSNLPRQLSDSGNFTNIYGRSSFGIRLMIPTGFYRKSERAVKYAILFIVLTFVSFFLFEIFFSLRFHPFQYLLIGGALCVFYVLFLALAEHIGFYLAYFLSTLTIVGMISAYSRTLLRAGKRVFILTAIMTGLYTYLLITLQSQDYALLFGATALTAGLGLVMYITRRVDWYRVRLSTVRS